MIARVHTVQAYTSEGVLPVRGALQRAKELCQAMVQFNMQKDIEDIRLASLCRHWKLFTGDTNQGVDWA